MALSGTAALAMLMALLESGMGATIYTEKESHTMRREPNSHRVVLTAHAEMLQTTGELEADAAAEPHKMLKDAKKTGSGDAYCNEDFTVGAELSVLCPDQAHDHIILDEGLCEEAAKKSGATWLSHGAVCHGQEDENAHPKGCFKEGNASTGVTYRYNGIGDWPTNVTAGAPICVRAMLKNGTKDSNGLNDDCPTGYAVIMDEATCTSKAGCLGLQSNEAHFRTGTDFPANESKHQDYPRGCYIDNHDHEVYFNIWNISESGKSIGTNVLGTPICKVITPVNWTANATATT